MFSSRMVVYNKDLVSWYNDCNNCVFRLQGGVSFAFLHLIGW